MRLATHACDHSNTTRKARLSMSASVRRWPWRLLLTWLLPVHALAARSTDHCRVPYGTLTRPGTVSFNQRPGAMPGLRPLSGRGVGCRSTVSLSTPPQSRLYRLLLLVLVQLYGRQSRHVELPRLLTRRRLQRRYKYHAQTCSYSFRNFKKRKRNSKEPLSNGHCQQLFTG
jgi:hypothetical protein